MVEEVKAYKTKDGDIFIKKEEAERHELVSNVYNLFMHQCDEPANLANAVWKYRHELYALLTPHCAPQAEEAGK